MIATKAMLACANPWYTRYERSTKCLIIIISPAGLQESRNCWGSITHYFSLKQEILEFNLFMLLSYSAILSQLSDQSLDPMYRDGPRPRSNSIFLTQTLFESDLQSKTDFHLRDVKRLINKGNFSRLINSCIGLNPPFPFFCLLLFHPLSFPSLSSSLSIFT